MIWTCGSCFSGKEGLGLAMQQVGFRIRWQVEIDAWCRRVLAQRFPYSQIFEDICNVGKHNLRLVDFICGGFPCQDISVASRYQRTGVNGKRSGFWFEFARVIGELRPAFILLENADEICAPIRERGTKRVISRAPGFAVIESLAEMGFDAQWGIVPASAVGAPHKRDRWWLIAWNVSNASSIRQRAQANAQRGLGYSESVEEITHSGQAIETVTGRQSATLSYPGSKRLEGQISISRRIEKKVATIDRNRGDQYSAYESDMGRIVFDGLSSRLERFARTELWAAPLGAEPYPYEPPRLSDDDYDWKERTQANGNAVCVPVVRAFAEGIKAAMDTLYRQEYEKAISVYHRAA